MTEPIRPDEVVHLKKESALRPEVFKVFNELIAKHWDGRIARVPQEEAVERISGATGLPAIQIFADRLLDVEDVYRSYGWKVTYDKPGFNESYPATFEFRAGGP